MTDLNQLEAKPATVGPVVTIPNPLPNPWLNPVATSQIAGVIVLMINNFAHSGISGVTVTDGDTALLTTQITNVIGVLLFVAGLVAHAWNHRKTLPPGTSIPVTTPPIVVVPVQPQPPAP